MLTKTETVASASNLSVKVGKRRNSRLAVKDLNLELSYGVHGLLGPNGAGKTTLMRTLATVIQPTTGELEMLGHDVSKPGPRRLYRRELGYLPQTFGFYPRFTVKEFIEYFAWLKEMPANKTATRVREVVDQVGLGDRLNAKLKTLSGGMIRRVGLAQALVNEPRVLLLDEPTAGLDPEQRVDFRHLIRDLSADTAILISTHLVEDVASACDEVSIMNEGKLIYSATPAQLETAGEALVSNPDYANVSSIERGYLAELRRDRK